MSEPDKGPASFLQRWSRRKQAAATPGRGEDAPADAAKAESGAPPDSPAFDPKTLPPIESITATSDIRAFLAPGVPVELSRAAFRRAWTSDPAIRDFIGLAENQWDFTQPDSVPGFGSLQWTPELRTLLARLVGDATNEPLPEQPPGAQSGQQTIETSGELPPPPRSPVDNDVAEAADCAQPDFVVQPNNYAATQNDEPDAELPARRRHGSAVPR